MSVYLGVPGQVGPGRARPTSSGPAGATPDAGRWFDPAVDLPGRKSRYLSRATRYLLAASGQTMAAGAELFSTLAEDRRGVVIGTNFADYAVRHEFDGTLLASGSASLNSIQAPNVSINMPATHTAIAYRCTGVSATLSTAGIAAIEAVVYASRAIEAGRVDAMLVGSTEDNGSDDASAVVLPGVLPGSATLAAFAGHLGAQLAGPGAPGAPAHLLYEVSAWHWRRYPAEALADPERAARLRVVFTTAMAAMLAHRPESVAVCWPDAGAAGATLQGWLAAALDTARIRVHRIAPPRALDVSDAGCNTPLMSLQFAMQAAGRPLLFVASHPLGNLVALYLQPRFTH